MVKGKVTRPAYGNGDGVLSLTATVTKGTVTKSKTYPASVKQAGMTDTQVVMADKTWLDIAGKEAVRRNLFLQSVGPNGSVITWVSSAPLTVDNIGTVVRPANGSAATAVTMTATIKKGIITETKVIPLSVVAWTNEEEVDLDLTAISWESIKGLNAIRTEINTDLTLPTKGAHGSLIAWTSTAADAISATGKVVRPSFSEGDRTVSLTGFVSKGDVTKTVYFMANKVMKLPITNLEAVVRSISVVDASVIKGDNVSLNQVVENMILPKNVVSISPEAATVSLAWAVMTAGGAADPTNPNLKVVDAGTHFVAQVTRPAVGETNAETVLQLVASSNASAGPEYSQNKSFPMTIIKQA